MKLMSWAFAVLGLWILLMGLMPMNWISLICGIVIVVLSVMAALKKS
jgi:hypothetical protein